MDVKVARRPAWATAQWWRQPLGAIYLVSLVMSLGRGAWFTCWAMFLVRQVGLTPAQFGIGVTAAGVAGLIIGGPLGFVADRVGGREVLVVLGLCQGAVVLCFTFVREYWLILLLTCLLMAAERSTPGIRIAVVAGLTTGEDRMTGVSTTRVMTQVGIVAGAAAGGFVLAADSLAAYVMLLVVYGTMHLGCSVLLAMRLPHVETLSDRKIKRRALVLRDRPFLVIIMLNALLALGWGMLNPGVPLWISHHTGAPLWIWAVVVGISAVGTVLFQNRVSRRGATVEAAARLGLWSGLALAASCVVYAASYHKVGVVAVLVIVVATTVFLVGELLFVSSGYGLSLGLTPEDAHGEYQGAFSTGQAAATMLAPGIMTLLLVEWAVAGWFVLVGLYLLGGIGTYFAGGWALRDRAGRMEQT